MFVFLGCLFLLAGGALLHDVPFLRFLSAYLLITAGQIFLNMGFK
jgi:hypothetical protein